MTDIKKLSWSKQYLKQINRNIGLVSIYEQEKIRKNKIIILGLGGLGGSLAEQIVRCGCENITICDNDRFEISNLNRQLCSRNDIGKYKLDVVKDLLLSINPKINLDTYYQINRKNIDDILDKACTVALTLDDPLISILIARKSKNKDIPLVESYGIPFLFSWWFTSKNIDYELFYGLKTRENSFDEISQSNKIKDDFKKKVFLKLLKFPGIKERYDREKGTLNDLLSGKISSVNLAPLVRMTASYLAFDVIFSGILNIKEKVLAPNVIGFDYLEMNKINFKL